MRVKLRLKLFVFFPLAFLSFAHSLHLLFTLPGCSGQPLQVGSAQLCLSLLCPQLLQVSQLAFKTPWVQDLHTTHLPFRLPTCSGHGLHCLHWLATDFLVAVLCGQGRHCAQFTGRFISFGAISHGRYTSQYASPCAGTVAAFQTRSAESWLFKKTCFGTSRKVKLSSSKFVLTTQHTSLVTTPAPVPNER